MLLPAFPSVHISAQSTKGAARAAVHTHVLEFYSNSFFAFERLLSGRTLAAEAASMSTPYTKASAAITSEYPWKPKSSYNAPPTRGPAAHPRA
jgi:hypothetical protein